METEQNQLPKLSVRIVKMQNGYVAEFVDPGPAIKAMLESMKPSGPTLRTDDDIDRTIDAMIEFNKHMRSEIVGDEDWKNNDTKRSLVREGFRLSFPHYFEKAHPQVNVVLPQSFVFTKIEDLVKFIKAKLV